MRGPATGPIDIWQGVYPSRTSLPLEFLAGELFVGLDVLLGGFLPDVVGQLDTRAGLIKVDGFEVVADELLVVALLVSAGLVFVGGPEAGRIGS